MDSSLKLDKFRERNREHAKKTRLRKKKYLEELKSRLLELQTESLRLRQTLLESKTANILLQLSNQTSQSQPNSNIDSNSLKIEIRPNSWVDIQLDSKMVETLRSRVRYEATQIRTQRNIITNQSKNNNSPSTSPEDTDSDDAVDGEEEEDDCEGEEDAKGEELKGGSIEDAEASKKERNRMHAKLTRDRRRMFTSGLKQIVKELERRNESMKREIRECLGGEGEGDGEGDGWGEGETKGGEGSKSFVEISSPSYSNFFSSLRQSTPPEKRKEYTDQPEKKKLIRRERDIVLIEGHKEYSSTSLALHGVPSPPSPSPSTTPPPPLLPCSVLPQNIASSIPPSLLPSLLPQFIQYPHTQSLSSLSSLSSVSSVSPYSPSPYSPTPYSSPTLTPSPPPSPLSTSTITAFSSLSPFSPTIQSTASLPLVPLHLPIPLPLPLSILPVLTPSATSHSPLNSNHNININPSSHSPYPHPPPSPPNTLASSCLFLPLDHPQTCPPIPSSLPSSPLSVYSVHPTVFSSLLKNISIPPRLSNPPALCLSPSHQSSSLSSSSSLPSNKQSNHLSSFNPSPSPSPSPSPQTL